jgi:fimbrial chaperone protein
MRIRTLAAMLAFACLSITDVGAASLRVAPVRLDVAAGAATTTLRVWNDDDASVKIQVRVYRWTKENGTDVLRPTKDVVVSPPIGTLKPGGENLIRIVRVAKAPVSENEKYRVLVDQLPDPKGSKAGVVSVLVRHAIPLYFD